MVESWLFGGSAAARVHCGESLSPDANRNHNIHDPDSNGTLRLCILRGALRHAGRRRFNIFGFALFYGAGSGTIPSVTVGCTIEYGCELSFQSVRYLLVFVEAPTALGPLWPFPLRSGKKMTGS